MPPVGGAGKPRPPPPLAGVPVSFQNPSSHWLPRPLPRCAATARARAARARSERARARAAGIRCTPCASATPLRKLVPSGRRVPPVARPWSTGQATPGCPGVTPAGSGLQRRAGRERKGAGPRPVPPPRRDTRRRGPKPRGEAAGACEPLGLLRVYAVSARPASPSAGLGPPGPVCGAPARSARLLRPGRPPSRVRAGPARGGAEREAARDAALQVRLPGAPLRARWRGPPPPSEDPTTRYARGRRAGRGGGRGRALARTNPPAPPHSQGGQGELREGVPGGRRAGQRWLRHGLRGQSHCRRTPSE